MKFKGVHLLILPIFLFFTACYHHGFGIGGTVSGLAGTLVLQINGHEELTLTEDGAFIFETRFSSSDSYEVIIVEQPDDQTCVITQNTGTFIMVDIDDVEVICTGGTTYSVGGTVSGLEGMLVLQNNGTDDLTLTTDGVFTFDTTLSEESVYDVTILTQPAIQTCYISDGSGTMGASDVTSVSVNCEKSIVYVTPLSPDAANASQIQIYSLNQDGLLSLYQDATEIEGHYGQMTFATVEGAHYVYILEDGVTYCSVNSDATFENCTPTTAPATGVNHPRSIAFATVNGTQYAYFSDPSTSSLFQCTIDITNGDLTSCSEYADMNIDAAFGITFDTDASDAQHAYIADAATGMVICTLNVTTGSFVSCAITPSLGVPSWVPYGITFATAGETRYAYVADNGIGENLGHVYQCLLNADGTFQDSSCVATPTDTSSYAPWNPDFIAFKTLNGIQYAYVVNNQGVNIGSIYRCTIDETTGLLNQDCIITPDNTTSRDTWQPSGIAVR